MLIDGNKIIIDYEGRPIPFRDGADKASRDLLVKDVIMTVLCIPQKGLSWSDHIDRDQLTRAFYWAKEPIEISVEQASMIKKLVCAGGFTSRAVVQVGNILEGKDV